MIEEEDKMTIEEETSTEPKTTTKEIEDHFLDLEAMMDIEMGTSIITTKDTTT